jgi:hypothetical protein
MINMGLVTHACRSVKSRSCAVQTLHAQHLAPCLARFFCPNSGLFVMQALPASPAAARSPSPFASPQLQQQQQQQRPHMSAMQVSISQVADEIQFAALHAELQSMKRRLQDVEQAAPLDGLQCGAVEARLAILEEDYAARHAELDDAAGEGQPEQQQRYQVSWHAQHLIQCRCGCSTTCGWLVGQQQPAKDIDQVLYGFAEVLQINAIVCVCNSPSAGC